MEEEDQRDVAACTVVLHPARMVVVALAARVTGLTPKAIHQKIDKGEWVQGKEWHRGPDGRRYVDLEGYTAWVKRGRT